MAANGIFFEKEFNLLEAKKKIMGSLGRYY